MNCEVAILHGQQLGPEIEGGWSEVGDMFLLLPPPKNILTIALVSGMSTIMYGPKQTINAPAPKYAYLNSILSASTISSISLLTRAVASAKALSCWLCKEGEGEKEDQYLVEEKSLGRWRDLHPKTQLQIYEAKTMMKHRHEKEISVYIN